MSNILTEYRSFWICLVLTLATTAVYYQVWTYDFVSFDDNSYVYANPNIKAGITLETIKWAFYNEYWYMWHPLTWISHMLAWQLFGSNAGGHHLTNLVFHIANTLLLFLVLKQMTGALWSSAFVVALFALHPLHVESVAWVTERKDVLSTFFWLLTMWAYVRFVRHPKIVNYLLVVVFSALGLMSKPMLVTLPFVLLLLDYWPLERLGSKRSLFYLLIEKTPLFAMALAMCIITFIVQKKGGLMNTEGYSFPVRLANASISYLQYIIKMIWPAQLAVLYPHPGQNVSILYAVISAVFLVAVTILILLFSKNRRYLVTGWLWYVGTLVPVIGLVQVAQQAFADRYSYMTLTGLFIIIAWGLPELLEKWPYKKIALSISALLIILAISICTHFQLRYWRNSQILFQRALDVTKNNCMIHGNMAELLQEQGKLDEAIYHYNEAIRIRPDYLDFRINLTYVLDEAGRFNEAIEQSEELLKIKPDYAKAQNNFGVALLHTGRVQDAIERFRLAVKYDPNYLLAYFNLAAALQNQGKLEEAVSCYKQSLKIKPDNVNCRLKLVAVLGEIGKLDEAVNESRKCLQASPGDPNVLNTFGAMLGRQGKFDEAADYFNRAIQIDPDYTEARNNLNLALAKKQKPQNTENTKK